MKPLFDTRLIWGLFLAFMLIACLGVVLVISASVKLAPPGSTPKGPSPPETAVKVKIDGATVDISTAIPGLVVFVMGAVGLLLLAIRVPVKQVRGYEKPPKGAMHEVLGYILQTPSPILSDRTERVPLLLWWLIRKRGLAIRVDT
jgi:hypothetical protein